MSRIDTKSISALIDQALSGNFLNLAETLHRFNTLPYPDVVAHRYPPSNISMTDDNTWLIELAVAGFSQDDLQVTLDEKDNVLTVRGELEKQEELADSVRYLKRGIGLRSFTESYALADNAKIKSVTLTNGLLKVTIEREAPKPKITNAPKVLQITA